MLISSFGGIQKFDVSSEQERYAKKMFTRVRIAYPRGLQREHQKALLKLSGKIKIYALLINTTELKKYISTV
jgi:hypothetical protein